MVENFRWITKGEPLPRTWLVEVRASEDNKVNVRLHCGTVNASITRGVPALICRQKWIGFVCARVEKFRYFAAVCSLTPFAVVRAIRCIRARSFHMHQQSAPAAAPRQSDIVADKTTILEALVGNWTRFAFPIVFRKLFTRASFASASAPVPSRVVFRMRRKQIVANK